MKLVFYVERISMPDDKPGKITVIKRFRKAEQALNYADSLPTLHRDDEWYEVTVHEG